MSQAVSAEEPSAEKPATKIPPALSFKVQSLEGKEVDLAQYQGKVVLVVNVASKCGLTPQYKALEAPVPEIQGPRTRDSRVSLQPVSRAGTGHGRRNPQFLHVEIQRDVPAHGQGRGQRQGTCDLYKHLKSLDPKPKGKGEIAWNFEKFVIGRDGALSPASNPAPCPTRPR